jgi:hypothetical protein
MEKNSGAGVHDRLVGASYECNAPPEVAGPVRRQKRTEDWRRRPDVLTRRRRIVGESSHKILALLQAGAIGKISAGAPVHQTDRAYLVFPSLAVCRRGPPRCRGLFALDLFFSPYFFEGKQVRCVAGSRKETRIDRTSQNSHFYQVVFAAKSWRIPQFFRFDVLS